ncbi:MAG: hypothetical protein ABI792_01785 [bacterium]
MSPVINALPNVIFPPRSLLFSRSARKYISAVRIIKNGVTTNG